MQLNFFQYLFLVIFFNFYDYTYIINKFEDKNLFIEKRLLEHTIVKNFYTRGTQISKLNVFNLSNIYNFDNQTFKQDVFFIFYIFYKRYYLKKFNYYKNSINNIFNPNYDNFSLTFFFFFFKQRV